MFSNQDESNQFAKIAKDLRYHSIVCTEPLLCSKPISQKKIFGVRYVLENTNIDRVAVVDVDSIFTKTVDYDFFFADKLSKNTLYASYVNNKGMVENVGRAAAAKFFNKQDYSILREKLSDFTAYFWFNDIPIYDRNHFFNFLDYINYSESVAKLEYTTFDFILYAYYLIIHNLIQIETINVNGVEPPIQPHGSFLEAQLHIDPV